MKLLEEVYSTSPIWFQNIMVSTRGFYYKHYRTNIKDLKTYFSFLIKSQWWEPEVFAEYQVKSLQNTLRTAFTQTNYYSRIQKELGCNVEDFRNVEQLKKIPLLKKEMLRGAENDFYNKSFNLKKCTHIFTSGTTGSPINILESSESFSHRMAFVSRLRNWAGLDDVFFPRRAQFTGRTIIPDNQIISKKVYWRYNQPGNSLLFSTTHISTDTIQAYCKALIDFRPDLIDGYPSALLVIVRLAKRLKLKLPEPKAIIVTAETLLPEVKNELQEGFRTKVFNQYAASEPSCFWCECEYGNLHINPEYGITEILNERGENVKKGEQGEIVVTSFLNPVMPLIRYNLGDIATTYFNPSDCKCGRKMPIIERVDGRKDDILYTPERGYVGRLDPCFKGLGNIIEAQIIQKSLNNIIVDIVPDRDYKNEIGDELIRNLSKKLGKNIIIEIHLVNKIARGANGKFRSVISEVKQLYPDKF